MSNPLRFTLVVALCLTIPLGEAAEAASPSQSLAEENSPLAGHFKLHDSKGAVVDSADLAGTPYAIFFGFTACPEVCPTTLADLSLALAKLPPKASSFRIYFVSVDPADGLDRMQQYISPFDRRIVPLGGDRSAVEEAIRNFRIVIQETKLSDGSSTFGHTASVFLVDGDGLIADRTSMQDTPDQMAAKLLALLS